MKVSVNWIKSISEQYQSSANLIPDDIDKLVEKIGAQLGAVEEVVDLGKKYTGIIVVKVISCQKHSNADKLNVCLVDDGRVNKKVKRNKDGLIEVVCGAPNVKAGMLAAWIPPGNTVPSTYDKEPLVLEVREIRGVVSNGMLASLKELAIGDDHTGILEIDKVAKPGDNLAELYRMNDYVIDIENKMFTHRPDCFGMLGIARELAGIQGLMFKSPDWYRADADVPASRARDDHKLIVKNEVPKLVPSFCALVIKDVKVEPSPVWLRASLSRVGVKSINNIVDLTNFYMYLTAQPLHAYDYDKVKTGILGVRLSKKGEQLKLLGGKEIKLDEGAVVITDGSRPIGLGGIMGGANTEVDENTKTIILECANFDMNQTRKTAMEYGLFTDAATRFTKNQSPRQNRTVIAKAADDILRIAGGRVSGKLIDDKHFSSKDQVIEVSTEFINSRLGLNLSAAQIKKLLENVEFAVKNTGGKLLVLAPFWRTDIEIPEDIVEEVGRLYGYDHLPVELPPRDLKPAKLDPLLAFKSQLRDILSAAGANEVLTYSFVHESLLQKVGQDPKVAYHIRNALSPDLQYYRLSLTPSLLEKGHPNIKAGFDEFAIFEINKAHNQMMKDEQEKDLPKEFEMLSFVFASNSKSLKQNGAPVYQARIFLDYLAKKLGIELEYKPIAKEEDYQVVKPFDHKRSAQVWAHKTPLGMIGEYKQSVMANLKLPQYSAGFEIGIKELLAVVPPHIIYRPLNRFPSLDQDFCLRSATNFTYSELTKFMTDQLFRVTKEHGYGYTISPLDIFQRPEDKEHKQTTWRITLWHPERTLTTEEVNKLLDKIAGEAAKKLNAERI
ncbi:MAG TPA: phenylalanine--tRNA ligase subunit beta [Candidatus Saccharimonadales bacterium]|nr:phenylalanine--tRNA ligase subunit beta [Candidatus Saccharimonadales bacterium]